MNYNQKRKLFIRIMCLILALLMVSSIMYTAIYACA